MQLLDALRTEHLLIESVVGSLATFVARRTRGEAEAADGHGYLRFFRVFANGYHHAREEDVLFPALVTEVGLPRETGPVASFLLQHHEMGVLLDRMAPLLTGPLDKERSETLDQLSTSYRHALLLHIDAENSVLLPESESRLHRAGVAELPDRPPSPEEREAAEEGERLARLHPPRHDPDALRGEGCAICPSMGTTCGGLEREWWNEFEWEEYGRRSD